MKYIILYLIIFSLAGCGSSFQYLVSEEIGRSGGESNHSNNGINIYVIPQNRYELASTFAPGYIPLFPQDGRGFRSYYYFEEPGSYSKPLKSSLDYFIVELYINSYINNLTVDTSSLRIIRDKGIVLKPDSWHISAAWIRPNMRGKAQSLPSSEMGCVALEAFRQMLPIESARKIEVTRPTCIVLRFPMLPIYPAENFSFFIDGLVMNEVPLSPIEIMFSGKTKSHFVGYRPF